MRLQAVDPLTILDCTYSAQDLFNALPRLSKDDQATVVDYVEMRLEMWRKDTSPRKALAEGEG